MEMGFYREREETEDSSYYRRQRKCLPFGIYPPSFFVFQKVYAPSSFLKRAILQVTPLPPPARPWSFSALVWGGSKGRPCCCPPSPGHARLFIGGGVSPSRPLPSFPWGSPSLLSLSTEAGREKGMIIIKKEGRDSPMKYKKKNET